MLEQFVFVDNYCSQNFIITMNTYISHTWRVCVYWDGKEEREISCLVTSDSIVKINVLCSLLLSVVCLFLKVIVLFFAESVCDWQI